jgi:hypothetical protein
MAVTGVLLTSSTLLFDSTAKFFARMRIAQLYALHIDPLQQLMRTDIRASRFAVYSDRGAALVADPATRIPIGNAVRCDRLDGRGWFILWWDTANHTLWLEPGNGTTGSATGPAIAFTSSISACSFDVSAGFLQLNCSIPVPLSPYFRSTGSGVINYALFIESDR